MKRYIFLSAGCALFFTATNFGMLKQDEHFILNQIVGTIDRDEKTLKEPNQQIIVYENNVLPKMVNLYLQNQNKSKSQVRVPKFKPGKPLNPLKSVGNQELDSYKPKHGLIVEEKWDLEIFPAIVIDIPSRAKIPPLTPEGREKERELEAEACMLLAAILKQAREQEKLTNK
jgi:hypothetical protein